MENYLGIDVSKLSLDVCLISKESRPLKRTFPNNQEGFNSLEKWVSKRAPTFLHVCTEATSVYDLGICSFLFKMGYKVSRVNPLVVKRFGQMLMTRSKTDSKDSEIIAQYCQLHQPKLWKPDREEIKELKDLSHCLDSLIEDQARIKCRLEKFSLSSCAVSSQKVWKSQLRSIEQHIREVETQIQALLASDEDLKTSQELLASIPGLGSKSICRFLAHIGSIESYENARQLAAHIGVTPSHKQSENSIKGHTPISKIGVAKLRKALFLPAVTAMRFNPVLRKFSERLVKNGKAKKAIVIAVMRKLIHMIYGVLKTQKPFTEKI